ncbi:hypothetical protein [Flavobacterium sp. JP2137]|uniref:hypothetical protein n=1 Tax=Flavobacterium sp. JP2137 TaxID=3414510 RepID=UPI003D2FDD11
MNKIVALFCCFSLLLALGAVLKMIEYKDLGDAAFIAGFIVLATALVLVFKKNRTRV